MQVSLAENITLESLLDAPEPSVLTNFQNFEAQQFRHVSLCDASLELIRLLKQQDVMGYFTGPGGYPSAQKLFLQSVTQYLNNRPASNHSHPVSCLLELERLVLARERRPHGVESSLPRAPDSLDELRICLTSLFSRALRIFPGLLGVTEGPGDSSDDGDLETLHLRAEVDRLIDLTNDWFSALPVGLRIIDTRQTLSTETSRVWQPGDLACQEATAELNLLNPDNRGRVSRHESIITIGDEVGPVRGGVSAPPWGGYREDRRNKVVPYSYLDYGPFASFGPRVDTGAAHCTRSASDLLLGTSWLPARMRYLDVALSLGWTDASGNGPESEMDEADSEILDPVRKAENKWLRERARRQQLAISAASAAGDHGLALALSNASVESELGVALARELDETIPLACETVHDDFTLYLANALTRDLIKEQRETEAKATAEAAMVNPNLTSANDGDSNYLNAIKHKQETEDLTLSQKEKQDCILVNTKEQQDQTLEAEALVKEPESSVSDNQDSPVALMDSPTISKSGACLTSSLCKTAQDLRLLALANSARLSGAGHLLSVVDTPSSPAYTPIMGPDVCSSCLSPSRLERQLAARLVGGLVRLIAEAPVPPEKVVNHRGVRKALKWPSDFPEDIEMPDDSPSSF